MNKTGAVIVAAGLSSRMKKFKPMLPFGDSTISIHIITMLREMCINPIIVVTGYRAEELEAHLNFTGVEFVRNERFKETDMFDSIKLGLQEIDCECDRVLLMPADTPAIRKDTMQRIISADAPLIRSMCNGIPGHPIIVKRNIVRKICDYTGEQGLRGAIENSGVDITNIEVDDEGVYMDADTMDDYKTMIEWNYNRGESHPISIDIQVRFKAKEIFFGPGVCMLLEGINQTGSIQEACYKMEMSYSKGSKMLKNVERQLGYPVVKRWTGGNGGGGSILTKKGESLIKNYHKITSDLKSYTDEVFYKYFGKGGR